MSGKLVGGALAIAALVMLVPTINGSRAADQAWVMNEITPDGPALFFSVNKDVRRELWAVHCHQPLRDCVARADGIALRLDQDRQPWLIAAVGPHSRISIQTKNYAQDVPDLFSAPVTETIAAKLSKNDVFLVVEEEGTVLLRTRTTAINQVSDYLRWISSNTGRTLRDARLWPKNGALDTEKMSADVLQRYQIMQRTQQEQRSQLIPATKPQVEFAMRAQGGKSFFSATGQSGY